MSSTTPRSALTKGLLGWALIFLLVNSYLGYGIAVQDWSVVRVGFLANLGATPVALVMIFHETQTAWDGRDRQVLSSVIGCVIVGAVLSLSYFI
jgi:hypothetical protein